MLLAIEGLDSSGKCTQTQKLAERVDKAGRSVITYSFPRYDTVLGLAIRRHLAGATALVENLSLRDLSGFTREGEVHTKFARAPEDPLVLQTMMLADKMHAALEIRNHLVNDRVVVCDRWTASAIAYGGADGLDTAWLKQVQSPLPQAHLTIFLDVPEEEALRRRPNLRDRYEKDREKQKLVRENYAAMNLTRVDGVGSVDEVTDRIWVQIVKHPEWE